MFIRLQIQSLSAVTRKPRGIFCALWHLQNRGIMSSEELQLSKELVRWFEEHLPNPPTYEHDWGKPGISWFKSPIPDEMLVRLDQMQELLDKYEMPVECVELTLPDGRIIFEDEYQIVVLVEAPR